MESGSIVKLYEYDIGDKNHGVDIGLYNALTVNLIDCALPIRVYDFDAKPIEGKGPLRKEGIAPRTFSGLSVVLGAELSEEPDETGEFKERGDPDTEWVYQVAERNDEELGKVRIVATALKHLKDFLREQPARVFYTINGQTHAFERASFLNQRVGLPDLRNHLLINIVCDDLSKQALATIFMPDRERKASNELSRRLEGIVIDELKKDDRLRQFAAEIRMRRAHEQVENSEATRELLRELVTLKRCVAKPPPRLRRTSSRSSDGWAAECETQDALYESYGQRAELWLKDREGARISNVAPGHSVPKAVPQGTWQTTSVATSVASWKRSDQSEALGVAFDTGFVQWQYPGFPSQRSGFHSRIPLHATGLDRH